MEAELGNAVKETLDQIDFGDLSNFSIFGGRNFVAAIGEILSGEFFAQYPNVFTGILALLGHFLTGILPIVVLIIALTILCGFVGTLKKEGGLGTIVHFVAYAAVVLLVVGSLLDLVKTVGQTLQNLKTQVDLVFPIILTLMVAGGAKTSAGLYQPAVAILSSGILQVFSWVAMPLLLASLAFAVVGHLAPGTRLDKFGHFFQAVFKWVLGVCFTVFLSFMTLQGITAGSFDSISIRATKMTVAGSVPIVGGYLSQGFDLLMASAVLVKNAVGLTGVFLLLGTVLAPVVQIALFSLALKLTAAITQPIGDGRISNFLDAIGKVFGMLVACLLSAAVMYLVCLALLMLTGNVI